MVIGRIHVKCIKEQTLIDLTIKVPSFLKTDNIIRDIVIVDFVMDLVSSESY